MMRHSKLAIIAIVLMFCIPLDAMARTISDFEGPSKSAVIDMSGAGTMDHGADILWNYTARPLSATLNIAPGPHTTGGKDYPVSPSINIAGAGDPEWGYTGTGYGRYGLQEGLTDGNASIQKDLLKAGSVDSSVLIPKGAKITSTGLVATGQNMDHLYTDDYTAAHSVHRVAYSKRFDTMFAAEDGSGLVARKVGDGSMRFIDQSTEPAVPNTIKHILMDDATGLLFVATWSGLYVLNWSEMKVVTVLNTGTTPHTASNSINFVYFDAEMGLLVLAEDFYLSVFNFTAPDNIKNIAYQTSTWWNFYCAFADRSTNELWAGTRDGVYGYNLTTFQGNYHFNTATTPNLLADRVRDVVYDPVSDRLYAGTYTTWGAGGLSIINVKANTKYGDVTMATVPSIPNNYVWGLEMDYARGEIIVSTEGGIQVLKVSPLSAVARYDAASTPPLPTGIAYDIAYNQEQRLLAAGNYRSANLMNLATSTNVITKMPLSRKGELPDLWTYEHFTDTINNRVFVRMTNFISIVNLTTGLIERNMTSWALMGGNSCNYLSAMRYDVTSNWLFVACIWSSSARLGITNMTSGAFKAYYSTATTPKINTSQIQDLYYDNATDIAILSQSGDGITLLNLTTNTTQYMNTAAAPPLTLPTNFPWDMHYSEKAQMLTIGYSTGVSLLNLSSGARVDLTQATIPALTGVSVQGVYYDADTSYLFSGYPSGVDVINMSSLAVLGRYTATSNPALPVNVPIRFKYYGTDGVVYISDGLGAFKLDLKNNVTLAKYDLRSAPPLLNNYVYSFDRDTTNGWDLAATQYGLQIFKRGTTPLDVELRLAGIVAWNRTGLLGGPVQVSGFGTQLQKAVDMLPGRAPDAFGNVLVDVPMRLTSQRGGLLNISNISIEYEHTATTLDLTGVLQAYLNTTTSSWDHRIPIKVTMASEGKLTLNGLNVSIDEAPFFDPFPTNLWMYENSVAMKLLDIYGYVRDDYDPDTSLVITPRAVSNASKVDVGLVGGRYLYMDSKTKPASLNWTGEVQLVFDAMDTKDLVRTSSALTIRVEPLEDIYIISEPLTKATEDGLYVYRVRASSHRGLELNYSLDLAPLGMVIDNGTGTITWTPSNGQEGDKLVVVRVTDGVHSAFQNYTLTVQAVNDPPVLAPFFEYTAYEGVQLVVDMSTMVTDVDDPASGITVRPASSYAAVSGLTVTFLYPKGSGLKDENVTVIISDGKDTVQTNFLVHVKGVFKLDPLPDVQAVEGTVATLDAAPFIHDPQGRILQLSADSLMVTVNGTVLQFLYPVGSGMQEDLVTVRVADGWGVNDTLVKVRVKITPVFPTISISEPTDRAKLGVGKLKVSGTAGIPSGSLSRVEVQLDDGNWITATGTTAWSIELDTTGLPSGVHYVRARAMVGNVSSPMAERSFTIEEPATSEVDTSAFMMMGLGIGLIIAIIVALVTYVVAKRSARRAPPPMVSKGHYGPAGEEGSEEEMAQQRPVQKRRVRPGAGKQAEMARSAPPPEAATTEAAAAAVAGGTTTFEDLEEPKTRYIEEAPPEPEAAPEPEPEAEPAKEEVKEGPEAEEGEEKDEEDGAGEEEEGEGEEEAENEEEVTEKKAKADRKKQMDSLDDILDKLKD